MPFTALNQNTLPKHEPPPASTSSANEDAIRDDFKDVSTAVVNTILTLWTGKGQPPSLAATREAIDNVRALVNNLKSKLHAQSHIAPPTAAAPTTITDRTESPSRKRAREDTDKINGLPEKQARTSGTQSAAIGTWTGTRFDGVSFTIPQRKKLCLTISSKQDEGIQASSAAAGASASTGSAEFGIPWSQIENVICLPVPEKTQAQKSFVILPRGVDGLSESTNAAGYETIVLTVPDTKAKGVTEDEPTQAQAIKTALSQCFSILEPDPEDFASAIPPTGAKKGGEAFHIKAFRGSKDGYLFLLPTGILWAFKKPLIFFSFAAIDSISYTSVLQRTFNLVISATAQTQQQQQQRPDTASSTVADDEPAEPTEYEFSMLDQADFDGIHAYITAHQLQDASLAEQRRAKVYNVNGKKGDADADGDGEGEGGSAQDSAGADGEGSELQKAQRELENAERAKAKGKAKGKGNGVAGSVAAEGLDTDDDEDDDENFDPGSEGESEGSGGSESESDSEDGDGDGDEDEDVQMSDAEDNG